MTSVPGARAPARASWSRLAARGDRAAVLAVALTGASIVLTITAGALGPSLLEPSLPGRPGQPPWALPAHPSPYLAVAIAAAAIGTGTGGLALALRATRRGWLISPRLVVAAGIIAAVALACLPPFGSSDHLSYAAYGRMAVTGHDPFTTTPAMLARLGDPVARAVQDWRSSPSVYGSLAVAGQALAALIGGASVRLVVFVLSVLNVLAFAGTGLVLHWLGRGDRHAQLRSALLWTCNPLLLLVLVAGAHVDSQAVLFGICAVAIAAAALRAGAAPPGSPRQAGLTAASGVLVGLGFAVKITTALIGAGIAIGFWLSRKPAGWRLAWLAAGFCLSAGASLAFWGPVTLRPALHAGSFVSIGSPWRWVRSALRLVIGENAANDAVRVGALLLAAGLLLLMLRSIRTSGPGSWVPGGAAPGPPDRASGLPGPADRASATPGPADRASAAPGPADRASAAPGPGGPLADGGRVRLLTSAAFAVVFAWLLAWPYVLPWYDSLGWALLALLPWSRLDWLMLARTAALAIGYLPARGTALFLPGGLRWLETVVRTAVTPAVLLVVTGLAVAWLWPRQPEPAAQAVPRGAR